jgi:hypothetical protein
VGNAHHWETIFQKSPNGMTCILVKKPGFCTGVLVVVFKHASKEINSVFEGDDKAVDLGFGVVEI